MIDDNASLSREVLSRRLAQRSSHVPKEAPMFNPSAPIESGRVGDDNYFAKLLGSVYGDLPIRSAYDGLYHGPNPEVPGWGSITFGRENGVLAQPESGTINEDGYQFASDSYLPGEFDGNVYRDRTGDGVHTGNSQGPIDINAILRFLKKAQVHNG